jgi:hypothetical protein
LSGLSPADRQPVAYTASWADRNKYTLLKGLKQEYLKVLTEGHWLKDNFNPAAPATLIMQLAL